MTPSDKPKPIVKRERPLVLAARYGRFYLSLVIKRFVGDGCQHSAAALTYMTLFAVVPMMTVMFTMLSLIPSFGEFDQQLEAIIVSNLVPSSGNELMQYLEDFTAQARLLSVPGTLMLIITSYLMLTNVERVFNRIWSAPTRRTGISSVMLYWGVLSLGPLLVGFGLFVSTYLISREFLGASQILGGGVRFLLNLTPPLVTAIAFSALYKVVPNTRVATKNALIGGVIATLAFEIAKRFFGFAVSHSSYTTIYGAFAIAPLFLLWVYVCWIIVLAGAQFVRATETFHTEYSGQHYSRLQATLMVLWQLHQAQQSGEQLSDRQFVRTGIHETQWQTIRQDLVDWKLIAETHGERYVLLRDLRTISLWDIVLRSGENFTSVETSDPRVDSHFPWLSIFANQMKDLERISQERMNVSVDTLFCETSAHNPSNDQPTTLDP